MPGENTINDQIIDSVDFVNNTNMGVSPSQTMAMLDAVMAETIGMAMHNAVTTQQNGQMIGNASVTATCAKILSVPLAKASPPPPGIDGKIKKAYDEAKDAIKALEDLKKANPTDSKQIETDLTELSHLITPSNNDTESKDAKKAPDSK